MKRATCLVLSLILLISLLASCADKSASPTVVTTAQQGSDTSVTEEAEKDIFDGIDVKDFDGKDFNVLVRENYAQEFYSDGENGEIINDAIYLRNRTVEDRFNIKINIIKQAGDWDHRSQFLTMLRNSVMAGDGAFDLVDGYAAYIGDLISSKLLMNLLDVPHLRLTQPWWSQNAVEELTVNGKLFLVPGDISVNLWANMMTVFFNKKLLSDAGLEDPYQLVKDGKWTIDKLKEMIKGQSKDLNGDAKFDKLDQYGVLFSDDLAFNTFHYSSNIPITNRDDAGLPVFNYDTPEVSELYQILYDLVYNTDGVTYIKSSIDSALETFDVNMFNNNQVLFLPTLLSKAQTLRSMEAEFGIIPYPKLTETQETYNTTSRDNHSVFVIPIDVKDVDYSGLITEALCVASNKIVIPVYYDKALKSKYARDDQSAEMLDLIREGLTFDFGSFFAVQNKDSGFLMRIVIRDKKAFTSTYEASRKTYETALAAFLEAYQ